ncbi:hypothetical protein [Virgibacillus halodenitrificans]|uniref:hypothetical protein n=1 Tax=Virgibacillus halodenitrificans TaxID=1482 RepID=UPI00136C7E5D|nr:hypothetical protein [Virgibacillus halodenitrificans]MYL60267.1 hypothetical protein [Virgibacillus halodenitrificans]
MRVLLELFRIILIFGLLGGLIWEIIGNVYILNEATELYGWMAGLAIYVLLFIFYRNKFQFSGWYKGKGREKLSRTATGILLACAGILFLLPFGLAYYIGI